MSDKNILQIILKFIGALIDQIYDAMMIAYLFNKYHVRNS